MQDNGKLLKYLKQGVNALLEQGCFDGGQEFRPTQKQAFEAYKKYLNQRKLTTEEKLKGFFEIPTGVGKTAIFTGIVAAAHWMAENNGDELKTVVVVPTTQLLTQTRDAFLGNEEENKDGFTPWLDGYLGLYGGGHKNLKNPITIMTYDAWYDLSQSGKIGSHNVDLLVSDEAHRGTSERRIENVKDKYDAKTVQIAVTATADFDTKKSVQESHERVIFHKSVREAILEGELASYIQSQRLIIRVEPDERMLSREFERASTQVKANYRRRLRQNAWNQYALEAFKNGVDERTGDPLSDNKAGFFVEGTTQADDLAALLNDDKDLKKKAKKLGCKDVAVAIHTKGISAKEQERRFKAYLRGEYMAVVGDEKFKEGFDYAPMKTIIDSMHASVVDKAQIIGRGARKWWNDKKQRFEGLTVVDTVVYLGSDDPSEDKKLRKDALRKAVSVKEIIEDIYILSPSAPRYELYLINKNASLPEKTESPLAVYIQEQERGSFAIRTFNHLGKIQDYTSSELDDSWVTQINNILKKPNIIEKNSEKQKFIHDLRVALGQIAVAVKGQYSGSKLFDGDPNGEYITELQDLYHLEKELSRLTKENHIPITDIMRQELKSHIERTGIGPRALLNKHNEVLGDLHINEDIVRSWLGLRAAHVVRNVDESKWNWVISKYKTHPDANEKISITETKRQHLLNEFKRTGKTPVDLSNENDCPSTLSLAKINRWKKVTKTALKGEWDWAINTLSKYPDTFATIILTDERKKILQGYVDKTGLGPNAAQKKTGAPMAMSKAINWLYNKRKRDPIDCSDWNDVINFYEYLTTQYINTSTKMCEQLNSEKERTNVGAKKLLSLNQDSAPETMTRGKLQVWPKEGIPVLIEEWDWVITCYKKLPSKEPKFESAQSVVKETIEP